MALVVEDGTGKTDAESYLSEADADAYHAARSANATWAAALAADKEQALRLATQYLDTTYQDCWNALRWSNNQKLDWPRSGLVIDGVGYNADDIPQQLLDATAELALKVVSGGDTLFADMSDEGTLASKSVRVGPITKSVSYAGGSRGVKRYRLVEQLISPLIYATNRVERV